MKVKFTWQPPGAQEPDVYVVDSGQTDTRRSSDVLREAEAAFGGYVRRMVTAIEIDHDLPAQGAVVEQP